MSQPKRRLCMEERFVIKRKDFKKLERYAENIYNTQENTPSTLTEAKKAVFWSSPLIIIKATASFWWTRTEQNTKSNPFTAETVLSKSKSSKRVGCTFRLQMLTSLYPMSCRQSGVWPS